MRHFFQGLMVLAIIMLVSAAAMAGNQETAESIAKGLRESGKLDKAKIRVQFQEGTAWLKGSVRSDEQMAALLKVAFSTPGVDRVINNMTVESQPVEPEQTARKSSERPAGRNVVQQTSAIEPSSPDISLPRAMPPQAQGSQRPIGRPLPVAYRQEMEAPAAMPTPAAGGPQPMYAAPTAAGPAPYRNDQPCLPNYAWPSYAAYPNYAAVTYPRQYSPTAWPYIGPFYPYPQVPLGWRKVTLEWDDGWWWLDFKNVPSCHRSPVGRHY